MGSVALPGRYSIARSRLAFYAERGDIDRVPSRWQILAGWLAMLPITLGESPRERERSRRTWLGQVPIRVPLQIALCPRQALVCTGLCVDPEDTIRHLLSVHHEDAFLPYDLQLLRAQPGQLERLADRADRVFAGKDRLSRVLVPLVGGEGYHARLRDRALDAMEDRYARADDLDPRFVSLIGFARFCLQLPDWPGAEFYGFDRDRISEHDAR
jgi:hypothetical protein